MGAVNTLFTAPLIPMITRLTQDQSVPSTNAVLPPPIVAPSAPAPPAQSRVSEESVITIITFLQAFTLETNVNLVDHARTLTELDFIPDIIPDISGTCLSEVLGLREGGILRFQRLAHNWEEHRKEKMRTD
jgi:hypothetical protein